MVVSSYKDFNNQKQIFSLKVDKLGEIIFNNKQPIFL